MTEYYEPDYNELKSIKYPNFQQTTGENMDQLLYKNHMQKLALTRFKSSLNDFKRKQKELEEAKNIFEQKEKELKDIYLKTLPYLEVIKDIPTEEEGNLKEWDDSVSSSFDVLKKYFIYKPLNIVKDKTIYVAKEGIDALPDYYRDKIKRGVSIASDYVPLKKIENID